MKKKISLLFLLGFFFFLPSADALEYNINYISNYEVPVRSNVFANNTTFPELAIGSLGDILILNASTSTYQNILTRSYQYTKDTILIGYSYGVYTQTYAGRQMAGSLYSYSMLVCSNVSLVNANFNIGLSSYDSYYFPDYDYKSQTWSSASASVSNYVAGSGINYCYDVSGYGAYKVNTSTITLHMQPAGTISGARIYIMGYKIEDLGYYHKNMLDDIEEVISSELSSAGVATKSDLATTNAKIDKVNQEISDLNDSVNNNDTSESTNEANSFFSGFTTDTYGLTSVITAPLTLIGNIASSQCSALPLQAPFINQTINLPCFDTIYRQHFGSFYDIYQMATFGLIAYWVCIRIFALVKDFKDPDSDKVEVMDL